MTAHARPDQLSEKPRRLAADLFALLGAPLAWVGAETVSYAAQHLMCKAGTPPAALTLTLVGVAVVAGLVAVAAGVTAWRLRRAADPGLSGRAGGARRRTFAGAGVLVSGIFLFAIVLTGLAGALAENC